MGTETKVPERVWLLQTNREDDNVWSLRWHEGEGRVPFIPASELARVWERAIKVVKAAHVYGPSNVALERDGAIQARTIIIEALEAARAEGEK